MSRQRGGKLGAGVHSLPEQQNAHLHRDSVSGLCVPEIPTSKAFLLLGPTWLRVHILLQLCVDVKRDCGLGL
jgi:hypothetical protein